MADHQDATFIEYVVKQLVENPDKVQIERTVDEMGVLIQLTVDPSDMGRVIGKEGRTAKALRTLLRVMGAKNNARVNLKIMEPGGGEVRMDDTDHEDRPRPSVKADVEEQPIEEAPADETPATPAAADDDNKNDEATEVL